MPREKAGETVPSQLPADDPPATKSKSAFAGFAALDVGADDGPAPEEEEEDFGGLMVRDFCEILTRDGSEEVFPVYY